jgi:ABC-2 type transport system ATP-binding protein
MTDRVAILLKGVVVATGTPTELTATGSAYTKISVRTEDSLLHKNGKVFPGVNQRLVKEEYAIFYSTDPGATVAAVIAYVGAEGDKLIDLRVERPSLEERFLEITQTGGSK